MQLPIFNQLAKQNKLKYTTYVQMQRQEAIQQNHQFKELRHKNFTSCVFFFFFSNK